MFEDTIPSTIEIQFGVLDHLIINNRFVKNNQDIKSIISFVFISLSYDPIEEITNVLTILRQHFHRNHI